MTREEIRDLQAGPDLDKIVAEKITGAHLKIPPYSTDIAAAMEITSRFDWVNLLKGQAGLWVCTLRQYEGLQYRETQAVSRELPESICKAALMAVLPEAPGSNSK
ncbi:MAG: hypothetical protein K6U74_12270 [Firmicutes bacterium]|nr:hypothetical protein [Bacillota bacterium]